MIFEGQLKQGRSDDLIVSIPLDGMLLRNAGRMRCIHINGSVIRAVTVCVAPDESMTTTGVHQGRIQATIRGAGNDCEQGWIRPQVIGDLAVLDTFDVGPRIAIR